MSPIRIATRKSALAMWQSEHVRECLKAAHPGIQVELLPMSTQGDKILDSPLAKIGGKGLFVKELEVSILEGRADIAVHSMKDMPVDIPKGLKLEAIMAREDPLDAVVSHNFSCLDELPPGARLGTSSLRRQAQIRARHPDLKVLNLRGNVNTRLAKLDAGKYDAVILACAGLKRLGFHNRIRQSLPPELSLPAIGQGAIGIQCRDDDPRIHALLTPLNDPDTQIRVLAERAMNHRLRGGCQAPIAGFAQLHGNELRVRGLVGEPDGSRLITAEIRGPRAQARNLGVRVAEDLLGQGAGEILQRLM